MFMSVFREVIGLFKGRQKQQGKVCPNGHVMHPSWDQCPYCLEMQQAMAGRGGGVPPPMPSGQGTAMLNISEMGGSGEKGRGSTDKTREVCGWMVALNGQHKGEDFRLRVGKNVIGTAADSMHGWTVWGFGIKKTVIPGRLNEGWIEVPEEGIYFGQCSQICGQDHNYMPIAVRVVSKEVFDTWVAQKKKSAGLLPAPNSNPVARTGVASAAVPANR